MKMDFFIKKGCAMTTTAGVKDLCCSLGADMAGVAGIGSFVDAPAATHPSAMLPSCASVGGMGCLFPREILSASPAAYTALRNIPSSPLGYGNETLSAD